MVPDAIDLDGVAYTVTRMRRGAYCCEPPLGAPIPEYALRLRLRPLLGADATVLFTDAARSAEVWCRGSLERIRWPGQPEPSFPREERRGCPGVVAALLGAEAAGEGGDAFARFRAALADPTGPERVRSLWGAATRLRVLDPDVGNGDWLIEALEGLEWAQRACLEQMGVWLGEIALRRGRRRPEYLRDFRAAIARADSLRETILLRSLYGVAGSARRAAACRRRLAGRAALPPACVRVRARDPAPGFASRARLPADLAEEVEALACAGALARSVPDVLALERRRDALRRRLDALAGRGALHPVLEWPAHFHLVRGKDR